MHHERVGVAAAPLKRLAAARCLGLRLEVLGGLPASRLRVRQRVRGAALPRLARLRRSRLGSRLVVHRALHLVLHICFARISRKRPRVLRRTCSRWLRLVVLHRLRRKLHVRRLRLRLPLKLRPLHVRIHSLRLVVRLLLAPQPLEVGNVAAAARKRQHRLRNGRRHRSARLPRLQLGSAELHKVLQVRRLPRERLRVQVRVPNRAARRRRPGVSVHHERVGVAAAPLKRL